MKAKDVKTHEDFVRYLAQIGARYTIKRDRIVNAEGIFKGGHSFDIRLYDKNNNKNYINVYTVTGNGINFWHMNANIDNGMVTYPRFMHNSETICKSCWRFSRTGRVC